MTTMTDTSISTKACCSCGADVAGQKRMKDSQGRYWCVPCGEADERKKQLAATESLCAGCRKSFAKGKLNKDGDHFFCKACLKKRTRVISAARVAPSANGRAGHATAAAPPPAASSADRRAAIFVMVALLAVFAGLAVLVNYMSI